MNLETIFSVLISWKDLYDISLPRRLSIRIPISGSNVRAASNVGGHGQLEGSALLTCPEFVSNHLVSKGSGFHNNNSNWGILIRDLFSNINFFFRIQ